MQQEQGRQRPALLRRSDSRVFSSHRREPGHGCLARTEESRVRTEEEEVLEALRGLNAALSRARSGASEMLMACEGVPGERRSTRGYEGAQWGFNGCAEAFGVKL